MRKGRPKATNEKRRRRCDAYYHPKDAETGRRTCYGLRPTPADLIAIMRMTDDQLARYHSEMRRRFDIAVGKVKRQRRQERGARE